MKTQLAFYVAEHGSYTDKVIAWWTDSNYSHVELVIDDVWYSSSPKDKKVRKKKIKPKQGHWDFVDVATTLEEKELMKQMFQDVEGNKYDWVGIVFSQIFPLNQHYEQRWFCSELCIAMLQAAGKVNISLKPQAYSPEDLYQLIKQK